MIKRIWLTGKVQLWPARHRFLNEPARKRLLSILLLCFSLRAALLLAVRPWKPDVMEKVVFRADARGYHQLGVSLAVNHQFNYQKDGKRESLRTPVYPMLVALMYSIFGVHPWSVLVFQALLDTAACGILYFALKKFIGTNAALWGVLFYAADPYLILYSTKLLSESVFVFLLIACSYFYLSAMQDPASSKNLLRMAFSGLFLGLAVLTRPIAFYLPFILTILFITTFRNTRIKAVAGAGCVFLAVYLLILSPWIVRNHAAFGVPALSTSDGFNALALSAAPAEAERLRIPIKRAQDSLFSEANSIMSGKGLNPDEMNDFQKSPYWKRLAWRYISAHPIRFIETYARGVFNSFFLVGVNAFSQSLGLESPAIQSHEKNGYMFSGKFSNKNKAELGIGMVLALFLAVSYALALWGMIKMNRKAFFIFSFFMVGYFVLLAGSSGYARFRLPAIPFYLGFIGVGADALYRKWSLMHTKASVISVTVTVT